MGKPKRYFSPEFKQTILSRAAEGESLSRLASEHDLSVTMICRWRRQAREGELDRAVESAPKSRGEGIDPRYVRELEAKLRESNERLGELYIVVEHLKKVGLVPASTKNVSSSAVSGTYLDQLKRRVK